MGGGELSPQRQRLAAELHRLRLDAGLSQQQLADRLGCSRTKVLKLETGRSAPKAADVEAWTRATGAPEALAAALQEMARGTRAEALTFRGRTLAGLQHEVIAEERAATTIRTFIPTGIPGLLQTRAYIEAIFATGVQPVPLTEEGIRGRLERQGILHDESRSFEFVIGEAALRFRFGPPGAHLAQLERLRIMGELPNVLLGILPIGTAGPLWWKHDIHLFEGAESYVSVETLTALVTVTQPEDVERYRRAFTALREAASFGAEALALLETIAADVRRARRGIGSA